MLFDKRNKRNRNKKGTTSRNALISYLLVVVLLTSGVTLSRYSSSSSGSDSARVARFVFEVNEEHNSGDFAFTLPELNGPGTSVDVEFVVTNKDGQDVCEVLQEYEIAYTSTGNLPLDFSLTGKLETDTTPGTVYSSGTKGTFPAGEAAVHVYTLHISWPDSQKDPKYVGEVDKITIQVNTLQIEGA